MKQVLQAVREDKLCLEFAESVDDPHYSLVYDRCGIPVQKFELDVNLKRLVSYDFVTDYYNSLTFLNWLVEEAHLECTTF